MFINIIRWLWLLTRTWWRE